MRTMQLRHWMTYKKFTQAQMAHKVGVSRAMISLLLSNQRDPSAGLIRRIELATNGEVTARDLLDARYL